QDGCEKKGARHRRQQFHAWLFMLGARVVSPSRLKVSCTTRVETPDVPVNDGVNHPANRIDDALDERKPT
ncbi:MAG: hypothetical protein ACKOER_03275, partial [Betaproteobacteria bacterium]